jgi:hypothetical protein
MDKCIGSNNNKLIKVGECECEGIQQLKTYLTLARQIELTNIHYD